MIWWRDCPIFALDDLGPLAGPLHGRSAPAYQPPALPDLTPLLDEVAPTLPSLPQHAGGLPTSNPFAAGSQPRRFFSDGARGCRGSGRSVHRFVLRNVQAAVVSTPQDAFEMMRRSGGIGNPFGYLLLSSVLANFLVVAWSFVLEIARALIFWGFSSKGESMIHWDAMVLGFGMVMCLGICLGMGKGTVGGAGTHRDLSSLPADCWRGGEWFSGHVSRRGLRRRIGLHADCDSDFWPEMFMMVMHFVVLTYAFKNARCKSEHRRGRFLPRLFRRCFGSAAPAGCFC